MRPFDSSVKDLKAPSSSIIKRSCIIEIKQSHAYFSSDALPVSHLSTSLYSTCRDQPTIRFFTKTTPLACEVDTWQ